MIDNSIMVRYTISYLPHAPADLSFGRTVCRSTHTRVYANVRNMKKYVFMNGNKKETSLLRYSGSSYNRSCIHDLHPFVISLENLLLIIIIFRIFSYAAVDLCCRYKMKTVPGNRLHSAFYVYLLRS